MTRGLVFQSRPFSPGCAGTGMGSQRATVWLLQVKSHRRPRSQPQSCVLQALHKGSTDLSCPYTQSKA